MRMAGTGSFARGDQPRTVPDTDDAEHRAAERWQREHNARQEDKSRGAAPSRARQSGPIPRLRLDVPNVGHPGELESLIPVWGSGREALADWHDGDRIGAAGNAVLAVSDLIPAKAIVGSVMKGAIKKTGSYAWRTKPWEKTQSVRQWLGEKGYLKPGEHGHHWAIPQNGWGKNVPEWFKNQPWNIKGLDAVTHGRTHGRYKVDGVKLPKFNPAQQVWYGTPAWAKAVGTSVGGHGVVEENLRRNNGQERK